MARFDITRGSDTAAVVSERSVMYNLCPPSPIHLFPPTSPQKEGNPTARGKFPLRCSRTGTADGPRQAAAPLRPGLIKVRRREKKVRCSSSLPRLDAGRVRLMIDKLPRPAPDSPGFRLSTIFLFPPAAPEVVVPHLAVNSHSGPRNLFASRPGDSGW